MTPDDDLVRYLESGADADPSADLSADELAKLDAVRSALASPDLWEDPPGGLEDRVVAVVASESGSEAPITDLATERRRRRWGPMLSVAAVAVLIAGAAAFLVSRGDDAQTFALPLESTDLAPGLTGEAKFTRAASGWKIELDVDGLVRLADGSYYEAWMSDGDVLVPVGTFNEGADVVLWAGVSPVGFPILSVTQEFADGDQSSSGRRVLFGQFDDMNDMNDMDDTGGMGDG
jgi:hypothetical protein